MITSFETLFPDDTIGFKNWEDPRQTIPDKACYPARSRLAPDRQFPRFTVKQLLALGKLFWHDSKGHLKGEYYLPTRQFVRYLSAFYNWLVPESKKTVTDKNIEALASVPPVLPSVRPALYSLARQLTANWSDLQKQVIYHLYFSRQEATSASVAAQLGISRHIVEKTDRETRKNIEKFCADLLPFSYFQDNDQQMEKNFLDQINKICAQDNKDRIKQVKGGKNSDG